MNFEMDFKADTALQYLFKVGELRTQSGLQGKDMRLPKTEVKGFWRHVSVQPACFTLCRMIKPGLYYRTDSGLYDRFVKLCDTLPVNGGRSAAISAKIRAADLRLNQLTKPTADLAMEFLRDLDINGRLPQRYLWFEHAVRRQMQQARMLLMEQRSLNDAAWIDGKYPEVFGKTVRIHEIYQRRFSSRPYNLVKC